MVKLSRDEFVRTLVKRIEEAPEQFIFAVFSAPLERGGEVVKVRLRPVLLKGELQLQIASFTKTQDRTQNVSLKTLESELVTGVQCFGQLVCRFTNEELHCCIQGDQVSLKAKPLKEQMVPELAHNRKKRHLVQASPVMQELGIVSKKLKQVNRFLELVLDVLPEGRDNLKIIDFGCGRAYLTFALAEQLKAAHFIGVDVREDVIASCRLLAEKLQFSNMEFVNTRIQDCEAKDVDLVVALHACDTATDDALLYAMKVGAKACLVAPCCQHEVAKQLDKNGLPLICKHNLLSERFAALLTDAIRAEVLEQNGYSVDLVEFIDPEHTPKNLLIRAVKRQNGVKSSPDRLNQLLTQFKVHPKLVRG